MMRKTWDILLGISKKQEECKHESKHYRGVHVGIRWYQCLNCDSTLTEWDAPPEDSTDLELEQILFNGG